MERKQEKINNNVRAGINKIKNRNSKKTKPEYLKRSIKYMNF